MTSQRFLYLLQNQLFLLYYSYNNIGLQVSLAKPQLRAEFENDLKLICEGRKDPDVVRREQIEKYKAVFRTVLEKMRGSYGKKTKLPLLSFFPFSRHRRKFGKSFK